MGWSGEHHERHQTRETTRDNRDTQIVPETKRKDSTSFVFRTCLLLEASIRSPTLTKWRAVQQLSQAEVHKERRTCPKKGMLLRLSKAVVSSTERHSTKAKFPDTLAWMMGLPSFCENPT